MEVLLVAFSWFFIFYSPHVTTSSVLHGQIFPPPSLLGDVAINCGCLTNSTAHDGRYWVGETPLLRPKGKSTTSTSAQRFLSADPSPYLTARISFSYFFYNFQVSPGQKFIRFHFYRESHLGFENSQDLFTVKANSFTLLQNFSASLAADALGVKYVVKEFLLNVNETGILQIAFFALQRKGKTTDTHAFVNGIEIVSMPTGLYYTPDDNLGAPIVIVGWKNRFHYLDNSTALELVQRLNVGGGSISPVDDAGMFRRWTEDVDYWLESGSQKISHLGPSIEHTNAPSIVAPPKIYQTSRKLRKNLQLEDHFTWKIPVDVGFAYLLRLHFCYFGVEIPDGGGPENFNIHIQNLVAETKVDVMQLSGGKRIPAHRDYLVMMKGDKAEGKHDLFISLQSSDELFLGLLKGLEIFKLSNTDNSLASPNPSCAKRTSSFWTLEIQNILVAFGQVNVIMTALTILLAIVNSGVYHLRRICNYALWQERNVLSAPEEPSCRQFSFTEILLATQDFNEALVIGKGGFGKVYKGFIYGSPEILAIKRLKPESKQGAHEFWREIETLSKLRHIHLVSLLGYCMERGEMILVYEYMPRGTIADNLYKTNRNGKDGIRLTWEQRLRICIGAARGLDYLHTGTQHGVIHRDVKDTNILLDENFVPKISDFGLSKLGKIDEKEGQLSSKIRGTIGYVDPEYLMTHKPSTKSDVYAFGIVMLVVLSGRPAVETSFFGEIRNILACFRECVTKGEMKEIIDPCLQGDILTESLTRFIDVVGNCLHRHLKKRPTMAQVVFHLEHALEEQTANAASLPSSGETLPSTNLKIYSFADMKIATKYFKSDNVLGIGAFGTVFKGWVDEKTLEPSKYGTGMVVAIKKLDHESLQGFEEWQSEVNFLGKLSHPNLVKLLGYCREEKELCLVYEFMHKGSLENHLFRRNSGVEPLSWNTRLKIAIGAAKGLAYLHTSDKKVIYRDFKPSNILLDGDYNAKISDFGVAKLGPSGGNSHVTTRVMGTYVYAAPEYVATGHLYVKSDVYGFGVVLLEMLTGLRARDIRRPNGEVNLVDWKKPVLCHRRKLKAVMDPRIEGQYTSKAALQAAQLTLNCLEHQPQKRPFMEEVVEVLKHIQAISA